jgi:hypothetical protein
MSEVHLHRTSLGHRVSLFASNPCIDTTWHDQTSLALCTIHLLPHRTKRRYQISEIPGDGV